MEGNDMHIDIEQAFHKAFYQMTHWVEKLFIDYERRMEKHGQERWSSKK